MYQITVMKFEPLTEEEKTVNAQRDRFNGNRMNQYDNVPTFPNILERGTHKVVKVMEVELTPEEFSKIKEGVFTVF